MTENSYKTRCGCIHYFVNIIDKQKITLVFLPGLTALFAGCMAGTILVFTLIYLLVFLKTSKTYYKIVGGQV